MYTVKGFVQLFNKALLLLLLLLVLSNGTLLSNKSRSIKERIQTTMPPPDRWLVVHISFTESGHRWQATS